jgi:hypothetical protein
MLLDAPGPSEYPCHIDGCPSYETSETPDGFYYCPEHMPGAAAPEPISAAHLMTVAHELRWLEANTDMPARVRTLAEALRTELERL